MFPSAADRLNAIDVLAAKIVSFPRDAGIGDLFHQSALKHTDRIALATYDNSEKLTYSQLDYQSDIVALWVLSLGLPAESAVAVWSENSIHYPVVALGILKAGLSCLPLDPRSPLHRIQLILDDRHATQPYVPLVHPGNVDTSVFAELHQRSFKLHEIIAGEWPVTSIRELARGESLAYYWFVQRRGPSSLLLTHALFSDSYTSGSTGKPKGLMINHHTIARVSFTPFSHTGTRPAPGQIWTNLSNNAWSYAHNELFAPLLNGATVVPVPHECAVDLPSLADIFIRHSVDVSFMVPALLAALCREQPEALKNVSMLVLSGDRATADDIQVARSAFSGHLVNAYGSSETHFTTGYFVPVAGLPDNHTNVPLGRPWPNMHAFILDRQRRLVPPGVVGTLYIASEFLARGYTDDRLNNTAFLRATDIFGQTGDERRVFQSGDQARWLCDIGQLEFLGRNDAEVKLRGQRIDLGSCRLAVSHTLVSHITQLA